MRRSSDEHLHRRDVLRACVLRGRHLLGPEAQGTRSASPLARKGYTAHEKTPAPRGPGVFSWAAIGAGRSALVILQTLVMSSDSGISAGFSRRGRGTGASSSAVSSAVRVGHPTHALDVERGGRGIAEVGGVHPVACRCQPEEAMNRGGTAASARGDQAAQRQGDAPEDQGADEVGDQVGGEGEFRHDRRPGPGRRAAGAPATTTTGCAADGRPRGERAGRRGRRARRRGARGARKTRWGSRRTRRSRRRRRGGMGGVVGSRGVRLVLSRDLGSLPHPPMGGQGRRTNIPTTPPLAESGGAFPPSPSSSSYTLATYHRYCVVSVI